MSITCSHSVHMPCHCPHVSGPSPLFFCREGASSSFTLLLGRCQLNAHLFRKATGSHVYVPFDLHGIAKSRAMPALLGNAKVHQADALFNVGEALQSQAQSWALLSHHRQQKHRSERQPAKGGAASGCSALSHHIMPCDI